MFRTIEYNRSGSTSRTEFATYDEASTRLDEGVDAGCLTGGGIQQWVDGIGWVVCDRELSAEDCRDLAHEAETRRDEAAAWGY